MAYTDHKKDKHGLFPWQYNWTGTRAAARVSPEQMKRVHAARPSAALLGALSTSHEEGRPPRAKRSIAVALAPLDSKLQARIAKAFKQHESHGTCAAIRAIAKEFDAVDIIRALPDLNPSTVRIQHRKGKQS